MDTILTTADYEVRILREDADSVRVSVLYDEAFDNETAPSWRASDDAAISAELAKRLGGEWQAQQAQWGAGDHPRRLESVGTFERL